MFYVLFLCEVARGCSPIASSPCRLHFFLRTLFRCMLSLTAHPVVLRPPLILYLILYARLTTSTKPPEHRGAVLNFSLFSSQAPSTHGSSQPSSAVSSTVLADHLVSLGSALPHQPPYFPAILDHVTLRIVSPPLLPFGS